MPGVDGGEGAEAGRFLNLASASKPQASRPPVLGQGRLCSYSLWVSLSYGLIASTWLLVSDRLVAAKGQLLNSLKGIAFVVVTATLLHLLVSRHGRALHSTASWYRSLFDATPNPVFVCRADTGEIVANNAAAEAQYGYGPGQLVGTRFSALFLPDDVAMAVSNEDEGPDQAGRVLTPLLTGDWRHRTRTGSLLWVAITSRALSYGSHCAQLVVVQDVSLRKAFEAQLTHHALHDPLTNLPNRALLRDRLRGALERLANSNSQGGGNQTPEVAVFVLDLDRFKAINDALGQEAGDRVLASVGSRLVSAARPADTVARSGGDEFAVIYEGVAGPGEALAIAERMQAALGSGFVVGDEEVALGASIGVALTRGIDSPDSLLRDADVAMSRAKARGGGRSQVFDVAWRSATRSRLSTEGALRRALERHELRLLYQPVVDLVRGVVVGAEALLRWEHPTWGTVPPAQFVPLAEESGLIVPIGSWVLAQACREMASCGIEGGEFKLAANLSARQLVDPNLVRVIGDALEETGAPAQSLALEITETAFVDESEAPGVCLRSLKDLGVQLVIDDFGTGFASLTYLKRFPLVDHIKIDRSFVAGVGARPDDTAIVDGVVAMAHRLGKTVTAEGVETAEQADAARTLGCDFAQGYWYAPPCSLEEATGLVWGHQGH